MILTAVDSQDKDVYKRQVLEEPEIMPLAVGAVIAIFDENGKINNNFKFSENNTYQGNGYDIEKVDEDNFILTLRGIHAQGIQLLEGQWMVVLKGANNKMCIRDRSSPVYTLVSELSVTLAFFKSPGKIVICKEPILSS